jgi:hypothetical protein
MIFNLIEGFLTYTIYKPKNTSHINTSWYIPFKNDKISSIANTKTAQYHKRRSTDRSAKALTKRNNDIKKKIKLSSPGTIGYVNLKSKATIVSCIRNDLFKSAPLLISLELVKWSGLVGLN